MLHAVIVANERNMAESLARELGKLFAEDIRFEGMEVSRDLIGDIKKKAPELLITIDLAGFERTTLTDAVAYNLLDCKQMHVIRQEAPKNEKYLAKPLSIAMFFYCIGKERETYLTKRYPNIPWLKELCGWRMDEVLTGKSNVELVGKAIREVIRECRLE